MRFPSLAAATAVLLSTIGFVSADEGPIPDAYPFKCANWCGPVVTVSQSVCLHHGYDCFCYQDHMKHLLPLCAACSYNARHVGNGVDFYPAVSAVVDACGFKTTSVLRGPAAATAAPAMAAGGLAAMIAVAAL